MIYKGYINIYIFDEVYKYIYIFEAVAEIARLHDLYRQQGLEIDRLAAVQNRPLTVNIESISDFIPESFSGTDDSMSSEDLFKKFVSWKMFCIMESDNTTQ